MPVSRDILPVIPVGEENAVTARLIWKQLGLWSFASVKTKLNEMAAAGLVERKRVIREARQTSLYFRLPNPSAAL
jgi:hypothetical protein